LVLECLTYFKFQPTELVIEFGFKISESKFPDISELCWSNIN